MARRKSSSKITTSSTAEYFSKNLQQVGFSSPAKAVLTTLKEAVDNSLDACEDAGILPDIVVEIEKKGQGTHRNTDLIRIRVEDNGPGLAIDDIPKVFGEYLASSKFGRGRCSRGQQGIGISAATTWAQLTSGRGATIITKTKKMKQAITGLVEVDIKHNKGVLKHKKLIDWNKPEGLSCEFFIDGRIQLNGEGGILTYLSGNTLVNPHLSLKYQLPDQKPVNVERVSGVCPSIPDATDPHPHTMKLGEFIAHSHLYGGKQVEKWLKKGFSRISEKVISDLKKNGLKPKVLKASCNKTSEADFKNLFMIMQKTDLMNPSTRSVMSIGEEQLAKSISRLGNVDFFAVVSRRPTICDAKPVLVEVAVARLVPGSANAAREDESSTVLRFANRVPLQFDKSSCAMYKAVTSVNWRSYGLVQPRGGIPQGPYVIAVSLVSPFIKFKNASKETVDASDELVEEIRRTLMQAGQRLSRHIKRENRAADLERKNQHIEQFGPILVECLCRIVQASDSRKKRATKGLATLLDRELKTAKSQLREAEQDALKLATDGKLRFGKKKQKEIDTIKINEDSSEHTDELLKGKGPSAKKKVATSEKKTGVGKKPVSLEEKKQKKAAPQNISGKKKACRTSNKSSFKKVANKK